MSKAQHLLEMKIFCNIINIFTVTFDQSNAEPNSLNSSACNFCFWTGKLWKTQCDLHQGETGGWQAARASKPRLSGPAHALFVMILYTDHPGRHPTRSHSRAQPCLSDSNRQQFGHRALRLSSSTDAVQDYTIQHVWSSFITCRLLKLIYSDSLSLI